MLNLKFGNFRPIFLRSTIVIVAAIFLNLWLPTNIFTFSTVKLKLGCNSQFDLKLWLLNLGLRLYFFLQFFSNSERDWKLGFFNFALTGLL